MCTSKEETQAIVTRSHDAVTTMLNEFAKELHERIDELESRESEMHKLVKDIRDYLHNIATKL